VSLLIVLKKILLEAMQKLFDAMIRIEGLDDVLRIGNEYSQIRYLTRKLEAEGCALADTLQPVCTPNERVANVSALPKLSTVSSKDSRTSWNKL
jgi:hypothetical protein